MMEDLEEWAGQAPGPRPPRGRAPSAAAARVPARPARTGTSGARGAASATPPAVTSREGAGQPRRVGRRVVAEEPHPPVRGLIRFRPVHEAAASESTVERDQLDNARRSSTPSGCDASTAAVVRVKASRPSRRSSATSRSTRAAWGSGQRAAGLMSRRAPTRSSGAHSSVLTRMPAGPAACASVRYPPRQASIPKRCRIVSQYAERSTASAAVSSGTRAGERAAVPAARGSTTFRDAIHVSAD